MKEEYLCEACDKSFSSQQALDMHTRAKHPRPEKKPLISKYAMKKAKVYGIILLVITAIAGALWYGSSQREVLPPTSMVGHIERSPASHVMREPMQIQVQQHMLEHADGDGPPGVIINYNCEDYECSPGLIEDLESFAQEYPTHVYVAPFPGMDAKIALTKLNRIDVLDIYDEERINNFILN